MGCGKPFCTCCETSYVAGLADGFKSGFDLGFRRGHRSGYVSGYLDRHNGYEPLPAYKADIERALPVYEPPKLPDPLKLACGCYSTCTCKPLLPNPISTYRPPEPPVLRLACGCFGTCTCPPAIPNPISTYKPPELPVLRLSCGCFGTCTCPPTIPDYTNNLLGTTKRCTCVGICICGNRY